MKWTVIFGVGILIFGFGIGRAREETNTVAPARAPVFTDRQILEAWGWIIAQEKEISGIEINETELSIFLKGFAANLKSQPAPCDLREVFPNLLQLARVRREKLVQATIRKNKSEARAFFAQLKARTNVVELPGGLRYEILRPGNGPFPRPTQSVVVHYFGHLLDGTEFAEFGPLDLILVTNREVCHGWVDALQKLNRGGKMKLYVPPPLSEKEAEGLGIEPGSARVYNIELFDIKDTAPEDLTDATVLPAPEPELPLAAGYSEQQLLEAWGWFIGQQTRAEPFGLDANGVAALTRGLAAGIRGEPAPRELRLIYPAVEAFVNTRREQVRQAERSKRLEEMNRYFAELKKNTNVIELPDGLRYEIVRPGRGPYPQPGQVVVVDYTGRLINGTVFDRTDDEPMHIEVGSVTRGFNEGILKINKGGRIRLHIPPALGFGDVATSTSALARIPAGSTLIYDIELRDIESSSSDAGTPDKK